MEAVAEDLFNNEKVFFLKNSSWVNINKGRTVTKSFVSFCYCSRGRNVVQLVLFMVFLLVDDEGTLIAF